MQAITENCKHNWRWPTKTNSLKYCLAILNKRSFLWAFPRGLILPYEQKLTAKYSYSQYITL